VTTRHWGIALGIIVGLWLARAGRRPPVPLPAAPRLTWAAARPAATARPWAPGACQLLAPLGDGRRVTVVLDPGHGRSDPGTGGLTSSGQPVMEKDLTLATVRILADLLRTDGYTVVLTRTQHTSVASLSAADMPGGGFNVAGKHTDILARIACANAAHAQVFVSLHFNGYADPAVGGTETFYDDARRFSAQNRRLAQLVQHNVVAQFRAAAWAVPDRGSAPDSSDAAPTLSAAAAAYPHLLELGPAQPGYLDHPSQMPGVLCEPLFLTNPAEATIAASPEGQQAIAQGLRRAIEQFAQAHPAP